MTNNREDMGFLENTPVLPVVASGQVGEVLTLEVLANNGNVDGHSFRVVSACAAEGKGVVSIDTTANRVIFNPGSDFDYLQSGSSASVELCCTLEDDEGAESTSVSMWLSIAGRNTSCEARAR